MSKLPVCVITQALSADFYFPLWHSYYGKEVGFQNLFVLTSFDHKSEFNDFCLGGVYACPTKSFDDAARAKMMASLCGALLECYEAVISVDTDEFLIPDPRTFRDIPSYLREKACLYVTSIGVDVFHKAGEADLDLLKPILNIQRSFGYLTSSMCKTSLIRIPVVWGVGFHFCNYYPRFDGTYLFHMKRADKALQLRWQQHASSYDFVLDSTRNYYNPDVSKIDLFHQHVDRWKTKCGWDGLSDPEFFQKFRDSINLDQSKIYRGRHFHVGTLIEFPVELRGRL